MTGDSKLKTGGANASTVMSIEEFNFIKDNRKYVRQKVTKKCDKIRISVGTFSNNEKLSEISHLRSLDQQLDKLNDRLSSGIWEHVTAREELNKELDSVDKYSKEISLTISILEMPQIVSQSGDGSFAGSSRSPSLGGHLRLPELPLPEYGHEVGQNIERFFTNFETVLNKYPVSDFEKFVLLKRQLSNEPLTLIGSLQGTRQSFVEAKSMLERAFGSKTIQKFDTIASLSKLKLDLFDDHYGFVSSMNNILYAFDSLSITTSDIQQYFIWRAMPHNLQTQFVLLSNKTEPNMDDIKSHIYDALNRYKAATHSILRNPVVHETVSGFAAGINMNGSSEPVNNEKYKVNFKSCVLCSDGKGDANHSISKCSNFSSTQSKLDKIKSAGLCYKCMDRNHSSSDCKFRFRKCFHCGKSNHFSFLCYKLDNKDKNVNFSYENDKKKTTNC